MKRKVLTKEARERRLIDRAVTRRIEKIALEENYDMEHSGNLRSTTVKCIQYKYSPSCHCSMPLQQGVVRLDPDEEVSFKQ